MRCEDWPERLIDEINAAREKPFAWGMHDCVLFTADCIHSMTGTDPMADIRGSYDTEFGAARVLHEHGYRSIGDAITGHFHLEQRDTTSTAQRGDVLLYDGAVGICIGDVGVFLSREGGLTHIPIHFCAAAWRVA